MWLTDVTAFVDTGVNVDGVPGAITLAAMVSPFARHSVSQRHAGARAIQP